MKRVTVSLPDEVVDEARLAVAAGDAPSVSAYFAEALTDYQDRPTLGEFLEEMDREFGPVSPEVKAKVDAQMEKLFGPLPEQDESTRDGDAAR